METEDRNWRISWCILLRDAIAVVLLLLFFSKCTESNEKQPQGSQRAAAHLKGITPSGFFSSRWLLGKSLTSQKQPHQVPFSWPHNHHIGKGSLKGNQVKWRESDRFKIWMFVSIFIYLHDNHIRGFNTLNMLFHLQTVCLIFTRLTIILTGELTVKQPHGRECKGQRRFCSLR